MKLVPPFFVLLSIMMIFTVMSHQAVADSSAQSEPFPLYRYRLANGLQVWCQPRADSESVAALMVIPVGARHEDVTNNGASHYVEHMLFTGTQRWSEEEIKEIITSRGGRWNGQTGLEQTTYFAHIAAQDTDIALEWLAQVVFHPTFPADKIDKERQVIFQEKWGRYGWLINTLDALGFGYELERDVRRALFPGSTLGLRVVGEDASLDNLDREALLAYYQRHYVPDNAVLIVVGNFEPDWLLERAEFYFGSLIPGGRPPSPATPPLPVSGPQQVIVRGPLPTDQTQLMIGMRTVGQSHPDRYTLEVLAEILDKKLIEEIRYRQGLVYSLWAYNRFFNDTGYFTIATVSERGKREAILQAVQAHLQEVGSSGVTADQLAVAQTALKGRWALSMEDNLARAAWLAQWVGVVTNDELIPDYPTAIDAVTVQDVQQAVQTYLTPERGYVGLHQPIVTVASGVIWAGTVAAVGLVAWMARGLWRRKRRGRESGQPRP